MYSIALTSTAVLSFLFLRGIQATDLSLGPGQTFVPLSPSSLLLQTDLVSASDCSSYCQFYPGCSAFSYDNTNSVNSCKLFNNAIAIVTVVGSTAVGAWFQQDSGGIKRTSNTPASIPTQCGFFNLSLVGVNPPANPNLVRGLDLGACKSLCQATSGCTGATVPTPGVCQIFSVPVAPITNSGANTVFPNCTSSVGSACSSGYPYLNGAFCCATKLEKTDATVGVLCDGGPLGFDSRCCAGDNYVACANPPCLDCSPVGVNLVPASLADALLNVSLLTAPDCRSLCVSNSSCKAFQFNNQTMQCSLFTANVVQVPATAAALVGVTTTIINCTMSNLSPTTTTTTTVTTTTAKSCGCPSGFPNAYLNGAYCCASNMEKNDPNIGAPCDGGPISLSSTCCLGENYTPCPVAGTCNSCAAAATTTTTTAAIGCPAGFPNAYKNGAFCCATAFEKNDPTIGAPCDGGPISLASTCCQGDNWVQCPVASCAGTAATTTAPATTKTGCPAGFPNPYLNGNYCCASNMEKNDPNIGTPCDGGPISLSSTCCLGENYTPCPVAGTCGGSG